MPERYEAIRDSLIAKGVSDPKGHAARIFNASRAKDEAPVTGPEKGERGAKKLFSRKKAK
jgi:hypothetical protein